MGQLWYGVDKCGWCLHLVGTYLLYEYGVLWQQLQSIFSLLCLLHEVYDKCLIGIGNTLQIYVTTLVSSFAGDFSIALLYSNSMEF